MPIHSYISSTSVQKALEHDSSSPKCTLVSQLLCVRHKFTKFSSSLSNGVGRCFDEGRLFSYPHACKFHVVYYENFHCTSNEYFHVNFSHENTHDVVYFDKRATYEILT